MELLYNPDQMPEEEIKATFVAREHLVDELVALVEGQPDGAGVQHAVIIAPRGMGKTTVLLMVKFAIKDRGLADCWQAVKFPEESYGIYDLADFWVETLNLIAADTADAELRQLADDLKTKYPNNDELQEAAYATIKDWRRKHGKRLLLLVENFDLILGQINDERDNARLRDALMNDGVVMFLGGATTFFKEARAYDQPLYNFFKIYNLNDLRFEQMEDLLRRRANLDRIADFETKLKQNASRLRALEYFTGGNPRLALMLYRVVSRSDVTEVRRALEKLLDEVTPYYKAKVETLPPQQRKILDHIARVSGETNEGLTPGEIAPAVRLSPNQVSSQLKRLSELGYVRPANLRGRSSCYALSEPLYAIWHQMRFGRDARERMGWLVSFLKIWYAADEFGPESERLDARFREYFGSDRSQEAYDVLEHHHYLVRAMKDTSGQAEVMNRLIGSYLVYGDTTTVKNELLLDVRLADLSGDTINKLYETGCINAEQFDLVKAFKYSSDQSLDTATNFSHTEETQVAEHAFDKLLETLNPDRDLAGEAYVRLRYKLIAYFRRRGSTFPEDLADDTLDRVARRLFRGGIIITNLDAYCLGVAKYVLLEYGRESMRKVDLTEVSEIEVYWGEPEERIAHDQRLECFQRCLQQLSPSDRELLIQYYEGDQSAKVENRELIAAKLGITLPSLRVRVYRLRAKMEACAKKCLEVRRRTEVTRYLPDDWGELARFLTQQFRSGQYEQQNTSVEYRNVFAANDSQEARIHEQMKDLIAVLRAGNFNLARRLIIESNLEEQLFPLARAIDYLQTGDEALIEKLSPEVRGIVEEVVAKLKTVSCEQRTDDQPA